MNIDEEDTLYASSGSVIDRDVRDFSSRNLIGSATGFSLGIAVL